MWVKVGFIHKSVTTNVTIKGRLNAVNIPEKRLLVRCPSPRRMAKRAHPKCTLNCVDLAHLKSHCEHWKGLILLWTASTCECQGKGDLACLARFGIRKNSREIVGLAFLRSSIRKVRTGKGAPARVPFWHASTEIGMLAILNCKQMKSKWWLFTKFDFLLKPCLQVGQTKGLSSKWIARRWRSWKN